MVSQQLLAPFVLAHLAGFGDAQFGRIPVKDFHDGVLVVGDFHRLFALEQVL